MQQGSFISESGDSGLDSKGNICGLLYGEEFQISSLLSSGVLGVPNV